MNLAPYISELLFQRESLILPGFGELRTVSSPGARTSDNQFSPPAKSVSFNPAIKANDYVLARFVSEKEVVSIYNGNEILKEWMTDLLQQLEQEKKAVIDGIGAFFLEEGDQLRFEPDNKVNFETASYGLPVATPEPSVETSEPAQPLPEKRRRKMWIPWLIAIVIILFGAAAWGYLNRESVVKYYTDLRARVFSAEDAGEVAEPAMQQEETPVAPEPEPDAGPLYHIIAGCFSEKANAERMAARLSGEGFPGAGLAGQTSSGLYQVSAGSFPSREDASRSLLKARSSGKLKNAWIAKL